MKILFLTKYSYSGASSRYRVFKYLPYFKANNVICSVEPLFPDSYLLNIDNPIKKYTIALLAYLKRLILLFTCGRYDMVYIHIEILPYFPAIFEYVLKIFNVKFIVDMDDAIFHNYDLHKNFFVRLLLKNKIKTVIKNAHYVITGSEYLTSYAKKLNSNVIEIPTSIDFGRYSKLKPNVPNKFTIGWVGSKSTSKYLLEILPALNQFCNEIDCDLHFIGFNKNLESEFSHLPVKFIEWNEDTEVDEINKFTIGIMPLTYDQWSKGKCGFKLIQYMGCSLPTISTPLLTNENINHNNGNLFANNNEEWYCNLKKVYSNPIQYQDVGLKNKATAEKYYSIEENFQFYLNVFNSIKKSV